MCYETMFYHILMKVLPISMLLLVKPYSFFFDRGRTEILYMLVRYFTDKFDAVNW